MNNYWGCGWFMLLFLVVICMFVNPSLITIRVRLPSGSIARFAINNDSSIAELCEKVQTESNYVPTVTDKIRVGEYCDNFSVARTNMATLAGCGIRNGELVDLLFANTTRNVEKGTTRNDEKGTTRRVLKKLPRIIRKPLSRKFTTMADIKKITIK